MHPVIVEVVRRIEEEARLAGIEVSDMMFLTRAEAQALMQQCDIEATLLDANKVDTLLDSKPRLLAAYVVVDFIAKRGRGGDLIQGKWRSKDVTTH